MAVLKIVPDEHYKVFMQYLSNDTGVILLSENTLKKFSQDAQAKLRAIEKGGSVDYHFGGEPDYLVDIITSESSYAYQELVDTISDGRDVDL